VRCKCDRVLPGIYLPRGVEMTALQRAHALELWARGRVVLAGYSAAALWGAKWIDAREPAACNARWKICAPEGVDAYYDRLAAHDVCAMLGTPLTTPVRTAFDLTRRLPRVKAVAAVDALYQTGTVSKSHLTAYASARPGVRGVGRAREVIAMSDEGAESRQETRARVAILEAGLPRPESQVRIRGTDGRVIGRVDLCWEQWRVIVEYDGDGHCTRAQLAKDIRRHNAFADAGWTVIRVKAHMLRDEELRRDVMIQIRRALRKAGAPV